MIVAYCGWLVVCVVLLYVVRCLLFFLLFVVIWFAMFGCCGSLFVVRGPLVGGGCLLCLLV